MNVTTETKLINVTIRRINVITWVNNINVTIIINKLITWAKRVHVRDSYNSHNTSNFYITTDAPKKSARL